MTRPLHIVVIEDRPQILKVLTRELLRLPEVSVTPLDVTPGSSFDDLLIEAALRSPHAAVVCDGLDGEWRDVWRQTDAPFFLFTTRDVAPPDGVHYFRKPSTAALISAIKRTLETA